MKKLVLVLFVAIIAIVASSSATVHAHDCTAAPTETHMQGDHCSGTVGCSCKGFSPKTNGDVWEQSYCKNCGHKKSYHR